MSDSAFKKVRVETSDVDLVAPSEVIRQATFVRQVR